MKLLNLKLCKTKKLHYGKYLYKLALANPLAPWFRTELQKDGNLKSIKAKIDEYQILYDIGQPLYRTVYRTDVKITEEAFFDAKDLYESLLPRNDYKIRVERWSGFCIYSNDKDFLLDIASTMRESAIEFWEPDLDHVDILKKEKNIILVDSNPEFPFKITLKSKKIDKNFAKWLEANTSISKVGERTLENIKQGWGGGTYFFVRDEKVLSMVEIIVGHNIQRIEQLVYAGNIDK